MVMKHKEQKTTKTQSKVNINLHEELASSIHEVDNLYSYYGAYASGTYSLISECNQHPHPDCIQRWRAAWCTLQLGRHDNGMVPRGQHDGVEQNAHPKSHDVRIGQDPKNELVDTFVARIRWGAVVVSAGKQRRPRSAPDLAKARAMGRRVAESAAAAATAAVRALSR